MNGDVLRVCVRTYAEWTKSHCLAGKKNRIVGKEMLGFKGGKRESDVTEHVAAQE